MSRQLRATLRGPDAELGRVAAADFANLLLAIERAVARAAGHLINRPVKETGRWTNAIEQAARLRLVAVQPGSVSALLETPSLDVPADAFDLDVANLGEMAFESVLDTVTGASPRAMPDVAQVLAAAATQIGVGSRFDEIVLEILSDGAHKGRRVVINEARHLELQRTGLIVPGPESYRVVGVLVEADFETNRARLRTPGGDRLSVEFGPEMADEIHEALRHQAELAGEVSYDPATGRARSVRLRELTRAEQMMIGLDIDFWQVTTVNGLATEQGVGPAADWSDYRGPVMPDDEIDSMLSFLDS